MLLQMIGLPSFLWLNGCLVAKSCPTLLWSHGLQPTRLFCTCDFPGKNTGEGCHFLLQGIFLTQELNPCLLLGRWILYHWAIWEASVSNVILQIMVSHYMYVCVCIYIHTHTIYSFSIHLWRNTSCFCILVIVNSAAWTELFKQLKAKS